MSFKPLVVIAEKMIQSYSEISAVSRMPPSAPVNRFRRGFWGRGGHGEWRLRYVRGTLATAFSEPQMSVETTSVAYSCHLPILYRQACRVESVESNCSIASFCIARRLKRINNKTLSYE